MFGQERKYYGIPEYMRGALDRYIDQGIPGGDFLNAVLENDLMKALGRADDANVNALPDYGMFLYNQAPSTSYGSPERVKDWIASGGLQGREKTRELESS